MPGPGPQIADAFEDATKPVPDLAHMDGFYEWLAGRAEGGLGGFNHPNLYGDFEQFKFDARAHQQMVSCEAINGNDDYLFWDAARGKPNPLNAVLNKGWRVGMLGVTDEHGTNFGGFDGKGRGGLWVRALTRDGVREALNARRFFATRERGLRLDAAANGVQMGGDVALPGGAGTVVFSLDIAKAGWTGKRLNVQVLRPGTTDVTLARAQDVTVPDVTAPDGIVSIPIDLDVAGGGWTMLRVSDPDRAADPNARGPYTSLGRTVAYTSPWWLAAS